MLFSKFVCFAMQFTGVTSFVFSMEEVKELNPDLAGTELVVHAAVNDWFGMEYKDDAEAFCYVQRRGYKIEYVGGDIRTFQPGAVFPIYVRNLNLI